MRQNLIVLLGLLFFYPDAFSASNVKIAIDENTASIENKLCKIQFDLSSGAYSGTSKSDNVCIFKDAWYRLTFHGDRSWKEAPHSYHALEKGNVKDELGSGKKLRVWYEPKDTYDPPRFIDITIYEEHPFVVMGWGVRNHLNTAIRVRGADLLLNGILFKNQKCIQPKVLRGGAGAEPNFVEDSWKIAAHNSAMLTYMDALSENKRRTIVAGGLKYAEFMRTFTSHDKLYHRYSNEPSSDKKDDKAFLTLTVHDYYGKYINANELWVSSDTYFLDFVSEDPFLSLERFGKSMAAVNHANPNLYDFPTLCGWMVSTKHLGEGKQINNSRELVGQMELAKESGITKYTPVAVRLEPDYYCYGSDGNTEQGWYDDMHWAKYNHLTEPYETFSKFTSDIQKLGGNVLTYFQVSMPSNDFALKHPEWMLNDDISLIHEDHPHHRPLIRYDFTNADFQKYMLNMWKRLRKDGVKGIKFDYPETGWAWNGGFDDKSYTTVSAYRKIFELCREGLGNDALIHERIIGNKVHENVPRTDCTIGIVDIQRDWSDASHFEAEMTSRMGLRWYKQGIAYRYYPDGKSFYYKGKELSRTERRSFLTIIGLLSGRIELGTSFGRMNNYMIFDLTRMFPVLPNGKSFRPVDMLLGKKHPEVYVYNVSDSWRQVILVNNAPGSVTGKNEISAPVYGEQALTGSLGLEKNKQYHIFDFWNQKPLGVIGGNKPLSVKLSSGEALVFAVKEVADEPQIIGTNRHIMCGMMELSEVKWDENQKELSFNADLIADETLKVTITIPSGVTYEPVEVESKGINVSFTREVNYMTVFATSGENATKKIRVVFK